MTAPLKMAPLKCTFEGCEEFASETVVCCYTLGDGVKVEGSFSVCPAHHRYLTRGATDGLSLSIPPAVQAAPDPLAGFFAWAEAGNVFGTNWLMERDAAVALVKRLKDAEARAEAARLVCQNAQGALLNGTTGDATDLERNRKADTILTAFLRDAPTIIGALNMA